MAEPEKIAEKIEKLLRLGGPDSGTTEHEQLSALKEAARLFSEHDFVIIKKVVRPRRPKPAAPQPPEDNGYVPSPSRGWPGHGWAFCGSCYADNARCSVCGKDIVHRRPTWMKTNGVHVQYMHDTFCR